MAISIQIKNSTRNNHKWKDLPRRLLTICVGVPALWMVWSRDVTRWLFFEGTLGVILWEWTTMTTTTATTTTATTAAAALVQLKQQPNYFNKYIFLFVLWGLANMENDRLFLLSCTILYAMISTVLLKVPESVSVSFLRGIFLIVIPFRSWFSIVNNQYFDNGFVQTVSLLLTVWNCDTGALVAGRCLSNTHYYNTLFPKIRQWLYQISPNKSLEGIMGGLALGTLTYASLPWFWYYIAKYNLLPTTSSMTLWNFKRMMLFSVSSSQQNDVGMDIAIGLLLSLAAILGDLWESSLKRTYSVKDSGKLLPGHGGVLDRFDSSLLAVMVYQMIYLESMQPSRGY